VCARVRACEREREEGERVRVRVILAFELNKKEL